MRIHGHGLSIDVPVGWEARIVRPAGGAPYLHVGSFALRPGSGQFGAGVTARMGPDHVFAALVEYLVDDQVRPDQGLFAASGFEPRLRVGHFARSQLQVTRPGHLGAQRFFSHGGRPFCLYAVIVPVRRRPARLVGELEAVLRTVRFEG